MVDSLLLTPCFLAGVFPPFSPNWVRDALSKKRVVTHLFDYRVNGKTGRVGSPPPPVWTGNVVPPVGLALVGRRHLPCGSPVLSLCYSDRDIRE